MSRKTEASTRARLSARRIGALGVATLAVGSAIIGANATAHGATTPTSNISDGPLDVLQGVGTDQSQRIFTWYYPSNATQSLLVEKTSDLNSDGSFNDKVLPLPDPGIKTTANGAADTTLTDSDTKNLPGAANQSGYYNSFAKVTGLEPATEYSYQVGAADGSHVQKYTFTTAGTSSDFTFDFFGDPQIGSSGHTDDDAAGWANTLEYATSQSPKPELLVSGGDQIEHANNEYEWSAFADSSDVLKQYPWAATIGNHDVGGKGYEQHNNTPNTLKNSDFYPGGNTSTNSGGDYWFIYKDVLFIDLNSNAYAGGADAEHVNYVRDVIGQHGDDAKWTVLVYHHSIYSPADHANDTDNQQRRFDFTRAFSELGVDLVLQGHDHSYSRSYALLNAGKTAKKANPAETPAQTEVFPGPGGVIYVTANSASGSKYYDLTPPTGAGGYGADTQFPDDLNNYGQPRHWANSVENQEHVRTYVQIGVTDDKLDVQSVRSGDCAVPNSAVINGTVETKFCGKITNTYTPGSTLPSNDESALGGKIGSNVDQFDLNRFVAASGATITGTAKVGYTLTAHLTGAFSAGTKVAYTWKANGVAFATGTSVKLAAAQLGRKITVTATGSLLNYDPKSVTSPATAAVGAGPLTIGKPKVSGINKVGYHITATSGAVKFGATTVTGATLRYQWYVGLVKSGGLTSNKVFLIPTSAKGHGITVTVTAAKAGYTTVTSAKATPTPVVK